MKPVYYVSVDAAGVVHDNTEHEYCVWSTWPISNLTAPQSAGRVVTCFFCFVDLLEEDPSCPSR